MEKFPHWSRWVDTVRERLNERVFNENFRNMQPISWDPEKMVVGLSASVDISALEKGYAAFLQLIYEEVSNGPAPRLVFELRQETKKQTDSKSFAGYPVISLNEEFTFETFVEGRNSEFAVSAAKAVADSPGGSRFNPLLIYGGSGLGKTHLLQAIGNRFLEYWPDKTVRYVAADDFRREYVECLRDNRIDEWSAYYRQEVDLLLMDDVQLLEGKRETQNEFFFIFNALHQAGHQIVLTCDNPPSEVPGLQERLISRFQWGLSVDVQPPDVETREAILRRKADRMKLDLNDDVIHLIAMHVESNVRVLEGVIRRLLLQASTRHEDITVDLVRGVLGNVAAMPSRRVNVDEVVEIVAEHFNVDGDRMLESGRGTKEVAQARQAAMFLMRELSSMSHKSIGKRFGDRDHSTVVHAIKHVQGMMEKDAAFRRSIDFLKSKLQ